MQVEQPVLTSLHRPPESMSYTCTNEDDNVIRKSDSQFLSFERKKDAFRNWLSLAHSTTTDDKESIFQRDGNNKPQKIRTRAAFVLRNAERNRHIQLIKNYYRDSIASLKERRRENDSFSTLNAWEWTEPKAQQKTEDTKERKVGRFIKKDYKRSKSQSPSRNSSVRSKADSTASNNSTRANSKQYWSLKDAKVYSVISRRLQRQSSLKEDGLVRDASAFKRLSRLSLKSLDIGTTAFRGDPDPSACGDHSSDSQKADTDPGLSSPLTDNSENISREDASNNNDGTNSLTENRIDDSETVSHLKSKLFQSKSLERPAKLKNRFKFINNNEFKENVKADRPVLLLEKTFKQKSPSEGCADRGNVIQRKKTVERFPLGSLKNNKLSYILPSGVFPWRRSTPEDDSAPHSDAILINVKKEGNPLHSNSPLDRLSPGGGGSSFVSREARREKASSSPVICKSSLSHSEWDIRRPWSEIYASEEAATLSQSVYRLRHDAAVPGEEVPFEDQDIPLSLPYIVPSAGNLSHTSEGVFQKFKKSLSLRLVKKNSRGSSPEDNRTASGSSPISQIDPEQPVAGYAKRSSSKTEEDTKTSNTFLFGHPIFRSSKERRRAKLRDVRSGKCNSGDSGDSGIELVSGNSLNEKCLPQDLLSFNNFADQSISCSITTEQCAPAAVTATTQTTCTTTTPLSDCSQLEECKYQRIIRRTCSDIGGTILRQGRQPQHPLVADLSQPYGRQYSSPQPIKVRPFHRLPNYSPASSVTSNNCSRLKRSKASAHLRRSVSQPLDLDKSFETQVPFLKNLINENEETSKKQQRRPSVGNLLSDENTSEEDVEVSDNEELQTDAKSALDAEDGLLVYAEALWDHVSLDADELVFRAGDLITVVDSSDKDWWWGRISTKLGWFPSVFVRLLVNQEDHEDKNDFNTLEYLNNNRKLSLSTISHDQIRANVINEIISTERDFVKHLRDVVEGYLKQIRKRPDMFNKECIATIFGNIEELYTFQSGFLDALEECIDFEEPFKSCVGEIFIRNRAKFEIYSEYCNNHPSAVSQLQQLYRQQKYVHFFEACRLLQEMIDISLDGFLLTPVQKICKYPLQLQELLKYTKPSHPDFNMIRGATHAMKEVALLVNERKRRMECLEKIASWQMAVEGWEGADLLDDSSQLIHQGELTKGVGGSWPKEVTMFLFDHQAVYCKRDLLKRSTYVYRGRINTDLCEVIDIPEGRECSKSSGSVAFSWKIHCLDKNKTYVFACKSSQEKEKWLTSFRKERELVAEDEEAGFVVTEKQKQVAKLSAKSNKGRPKKPRISKPRKRAQAMTFAQAQLLVNTEYECESRTNSLPLGSQPPAPTDPKKKGNWFSFGVTRKSKQSISSVAV